jgi:hypothetical protein
MDRRMSGRDVLESSGAVEGRTTETWRLLAEQLEPRIEHLAHEVEGMRMRAAPSYVVLPEKSGACNPIEDLLVKVEALHWMLRIGKRLNGTSRDMVMATVAKSAEELERAVAAHEHANVVKVAA